MTVAVAWVAKAKRPPKKQTGPVDEDLAPMVRGDLRRGLETFRNNVSPDALERAIRSKKMDSIAKAVPWEDLPGNLAKGFERVTQAGRQEAGRAVQDMPGNRGETPKRTAQMVLDRTGVKLASFSVTRKGTIVQATEDGTHEAIRRELYLARTRYMTPGELAGNIRGVIGLNSRQAVAVSNYRAGLAQEIRDPETGKLIRKPVPVRQRESMVQAQTDRMLDVRADNIARTELAFAANAARTEAWRLAQEQELLPPEAGRKWVVDGNPCKELCVPMNGVVVGMDEPWVLPDGREVMEVTEAHPACMCACVLQFA